LKIITIIILFSFINILAYSQETDEEEFIIGNKIYKSETNWFKMGQGFSYHFRLKQLEYNTLLSYSFKIKKHWFQAGYHVSSDKFFIKSSLQRLNDVYLSYGRRKETKKLNLSVFAGLSFAYGGTLHHIEWNYGQPVKWYEGFNRIGMFSNLEFTYKPVYDIGFGITLFGSLNAKYSVTGIMFHLYLSGAFKGKIE
jgi:hypothetical protein